MFHNGIYVEEVTSPRSFCSVWCIFRHLLADGSELLKHNHFGCINIYRIVVQISLLLRGAIFKLADTDFEYAFMI